jgi:hypothetical protein
MPVMDTWVRLRPREEAIEVRMAVSTEVEKESIPS